MSLIEQKPFSWKGLDLGTEPSVAYGSLSKASGIRYLERGTLMSRSGRVRYNSSAGVQLSAQTPLLGVIQFYDGTLYSPPGFPPFIQVPKYVFKAGGSLWLWDTTLPAPQLLTTLFGPRHIRGQWYRNAVYVADPDHTPIAVRRLPDAEQVAFTSIKYAAVPMGIKYPTDNSRPVLTPAGGGFINPSSDPFSAAQVYRVRVGFKDKYGLTSNPSLSSDVLTIQAGDHDKTIGVSWAGLTFNGIGFSSGANKSYIAEVQLWLQMSISGVTSAYVLVPESAGVGKFSPADGAYSGSFNITTINGADDWPLLETEHGFDHGHPPTLTDFTVVSDIAYAVSVPDIVYREVGPSKEHDLTELPKPKEHRRPRAQDYYVDGTRRPPIPPPPEAPLAMHKGLNARIEPVRTTQSTLMLAKPFSPDYMQQRINVGDGSESLLSIAQFGRQLACYTDRSIHMYDPDTAVVSRTLAQIGLGGRNSVVAYRGGHAFLSSDSTLAFFDGATARVLAENLVGLFKDEAWSGQYPRFDRSRSDEVVGTFAKDRLYYAIPTIGGGRMLLVIDTTWGENMYSIDDGSNYSALILLPDQGRLVGIDTTNSSRASWFFIEEGLVDQAPEVPGLPIGSDVGIPLDCETYLIPLANDGTGVTRKFGIDLDPGGNTVDVDITVDDDPALSIRYTFSGLGRREERKYLPARFKGRFLRVRFSGTAIETRVKVYKLRLVADPRGEL